MPTTNPPSTTFRGEISIISPVAYAIAGIVFVAIIPLFVVLVGRDRGAPEFPIRVVLGFVCAILLACYVLLVGYINRDAGRRGMSRLLWTLVAVFVPDGLGIVLYFVLRKPRSSVCPQCSSPVEPGFSYCPYCRYHLQPVCPHCQRSMMARGVYCPYCGGAQAEAAPTVASGFKPSA